MLSQDIVQIFLSNLPFPPTKIQLYALEQCAEYLLDENPYSVFLLKGYAGTGKTFLLQAISKGVEHLGIDVDLMASTGRAAKHLSLQSQRPANTIHKRIYRASGESSVIDGTFKLTSRTKRPTLFIVDEASMISGQSYEPTPFGSGDLLEDLLSYIWDSEGCKLILVGDSAQLPPVGQEISDALNRDELESRFGLKIYEAELDEVVRQEQGSEILNQATKLRDLLKEHEDLCPDEEIPYQLDFCSSTDFQLTTGVELIDLCDTAYRKYGRENSLIITSSNKRALELNQAIRARVLDYEERLSRGEHLIVARNNYHYATRADKSDFIANGEAIEVRQIYGYISQYGLDYADACIYLPDRNQELEARLLLTSLNDGQAQRSYNDRKRLYDLLREEYGERLQGKKLRQAIQDDPFWSALEIKYAYAVTAHKAQGGQWSCTFIDMGLVATFFPFNKQMIRWLYTAITRATEQVYLFNVSTKLLAEED